MKGFKGFSPDLICRDKQYTENTVFEEDKAVICSSGMHFCENPFDVFKHYPPVSDGKFNEFTTVEALDECHTDDNKKFCTKKLKIGAKLSFGEFIKAGIEFNLSKVKFEPKASATGYMSGASATGNRSGAMVVGDCCGADVKNNSVAMVVGSDGKAKGEKGCFIVLTETARDKDGNLYIKYVKSKKVDGRTIKADTYYTLKDGNFVEVS